MNNILKGATIKKIFITHIHDDHCNLLQSIIDNASDDGYKIDEECDVFVGGKDGLPNDVDFIKKCYVVYFDGQLVNLDHPKQKQQDNDIKRRFNFSRERIFRDLQGNSVSRSAENG